MRRTQLCGWELALILVAVCLAVCVTGCRHHAPNEADILNEQAKLPAKLPVPALDWRTIASGIDRTDRTNQTDRTDTTHQTMSLLTGNDAAVRSAGNPAYADGSQLALTTWLQRDDPHWFGARIAGTFVGLETVTVARGADGRATAIYKRYAGDPLREVTDASTADARKTAILGMRPSVMP
jgi:hypothetical protein